MIKKVISFIKYNNATILILAIIFVVGGSVFASETGREAIGGSTTHIEGIDNAALLSIDLDSFDMDFMIESIEEDDKYYYVTYSYMDLESVDNVWQYIFKEKVRKISKKSKVDLVSYMAKELSEESYGKIKKLKESKGKAENKGVQNKKKVTKYSGIIGKALALGEKVIPGFEAEEEEIMLSPLRVSMNKYSKEQKEKNNRIATPDLIAKTFIEAEDKYLENDSDFDGIGNGDDNCPIQKNHNQLDSDNDGVGDACDLDNMVIDTSSDFSGAEEIGSEDPQGETPDETEIDSVVIFEIGDDGIIEEEPADEEATQEGEAVNEDGTSNEPNEEEEVDNSSSQDSEPAEESVPEEPVQEETSTPEPVQEETSTPEPVQEEAPAAE